MSGVVTPAGLSSNLRSKLHDKAKVTAAIIQELTEELKAIEQESMNDEQDSEATKDSDLEQEDSENCLTDDERQWLFKIQDLPSLILEQDGHDICLGKIDSNFHQSKNPNESNTNHMEEVIIGSEQGTTFPTKLWNTMCNALIDTGATRCCLNEKCYKKLQLAKIHLLQNVNVRSATGSNLAPVGLVNCTFELGETKFSSDFIVCKNLTRPLILGRDFLIQNHVSVRYSENWKCILDYKQQELIASLNVENKPQLSLANSMTLPGRNLAVVYVNNNLKPEQSGQLYESEPNYL